MDYLSYAVQFQPIALPSDLSSIPLDLLTIPIPTYKLDELNALPVKNENNDEYKIYWTLKLSNNYLDVKSLYSKFLTNREGGLSSTKGDRGGLTNRGVTLKTWKAYGNDKNGDGNIDAEDLKLITDEDRDNILLTRFWNAARGDEINNPYLASYVVDWMWNTGPLAFKKMHEAFGLKPLANMTLELLDKLNENPESSFNIILQARKNFYRNIVKNDPTQEKFLKGWLRRADAISLNGMTMNS